MLRLQIFRMQEIVPPCDSDLKSDHYGTVPALWRGVISPLLYFP